jgi:uncharacterized protein (UPF0332 family)
MKEIIDLIEKAEKFINTAEIAFKNKDYDSCVSRCYYAMFFVVEALLLTKNLSASSHKGVISLFGEHFIKKGVFERKFGRALSDAYDKRLLGDYGIGALINEKEASNLLETAKNFVDRLREYLENWMKFTESN